MQRIANQLIADSQSWLSRLQPEMINGARLVAGVLCDRSGAPTPGGDHFIALLSSRGGALTTCTYEVIHRNHLNDNLEAIDARTTAIVAAAISEVGVYNFRDELERALNAPRVLTDEQLWGEP